MWEIHFDFWASEFGLAQSGDCGIWEIYQDRDNLSISLTLPSSNLLHLTLYKQKFKRIGLQVLSIFPIHNHAFSSITIGLHWLLF